MAFLPYWLQELRLEEGIQTPRPAAARCFVCLSFLSGSPPSAAHYAIVPSAGGLGMSEGRADGLRGTSAMGPAAAAACTADY